MQKKKKNTGRKMKTKYRDQENRFSKDLLDEEPKVNIQTENLKFNNNKK